VVDEGFGIHPDDLPRIFDKFGRGRDPTGRKVRGFGLGLYVSRRIIQAHGSPLIVDSKPGKGSTFALELEVVQ
jgi:signal transduction histidine kinase